MSDSLGAELADRLNRILSRDQKLVETFAERVETAAARELRREGHEVRDGMLYRTKPLSEDAELKHEALAQARLVRRLLLSEDPRILRETAFKSFLLGRITLAAKLGVELFRDATRGERARMAHDKSLSTRRKKAEQKRERVCEIFSELRSKHPRWSRNRLEKETVDRSCLKPKPSQKSVARYTRDIKRR